MGWAYYLAQGATAAILLLAANTSFADFSRLASLMARDRFLPAQFANLGDRLVFANRIITLSVVAAVLVWGFGGDTSRLIPLYAVGVFLSFTLSQAGMVRHWWRLRHGGPAEPKPDLVPVESAHDRPEGRASEADVPAEAGGWRRAIAIDGVGAVATSVLLSVIVLTKFVHGVWIVVVLIPALVLLLRAIHAHYMDVDRQLEVQDFRPLRTGHLNTLIVPVTRMHQGVVKALEYALSLSEDVHAVYVEIDPAATARVRQDWAKPQADDRLEVVPYPYCSCVGVLVNYVNRVDEGRGDDIVTVFLPEYVPSWWWQQFLHNQSIFRLKAALIYRTGIVVTSVPYYLR